VRVPRMLVEADGNESKDTPRSDSILNFNESSEKIGSKLAKLE
jgi:hypothetical protein